MEQLTSDNSRSQTDCFLFFTYPCVTGPLMALMTAVSRGIRGRQKQAPRTFATSLFGSLYPV